MRLFTAIKVPASLTSLLTKLQPTQELAIRLTPVDNFHITLQFIGEADLGPIYNALDLINFQSFEISLDRPGLFRNRHQSCVLWLGIKPSNALAQLHEQVKNALLSVGITPDNHAFTPHITLARCNNHYPQSNLHQYLQQPGFAASFTVDHFTLMQSKPGVGGPRYHALKHFIACHAGDR